jgi:pilus assembly protein CpaD
MQTKMIALLASVGLALAGCNASGSNTGLETVHQPVVARTNYVLDVPASMTASDAQTVATWLKALDANYGDKISIDDPNGIGMNARRDLSRLTGYYGLTVEPTAPVTEGAVAPGMVRVVLSRTTASVPGCPDWRQPENLGMNNAAHSNFGCAVNSNIAAMIADPMDLVSGKDKPPVGYNQPNRGGK